MYLMSFGEGNDQSAMMMEPVGGMDQSRCRIHGARRQVRAARTPRSNRCSCARSGVDIVYQRSTASAHQVHADYCLNCIPMQLLAGIEHNFPPRYARRLHRDPSRQALQDRPADAGALLGAGRASTAASHGRCRTSRRSGIPPRHSSAERRASRRVHFDDDAGDRFARLDARGAHRTRDPTGRDASIRTIAATSKTA